MSELDAAIDELILDARSGAGDQAPNLRAARRAVQAAATPDRDVVIEAVYRALTRYDRERRMLRDLRSIARSGPPSRRVRLAIIERGTVRSALTLYLVDAVLAAIAGTTWPDAGGPRSRPTRHGRTGESPKARRSSVGAGPTTRSTRRTMTRPLSAGWRTAARAPT